MKTSKLAGTLIPDKTFNIWPQIHRERISTHLHSDPRDVSGHSLPILEPRDVEGQVAAADHTTDRHPVTHLPRRKLERVNHGRL